MMWLSAGRSIARGLWRRRPIERGVRVLAYHGVVERYVDERVEANFHLLADFREHVAILKRLHVCSMDELDTARSRVVPSVAITFDDGFANNLLAAEILTEAKLPASFFVSAGNVDRQEPIWPTLLRLVLARGSARMPTIAGVQYDLDADPTAFGRVRSTFKQLSSETRKTHFAELLAQLRDSELEELVSTIPSIRMMTWRDVQSLSASFVVGSHGRDHELQHDAQPASVRHAELVDSKSQIERATNQRCTAFAFPNGSHHAGSRDEVARCGYSSAFTMAPRALRADDDVLLMPRLVANGGGDALVTKLFFGN